MLWEIITDEVVSAVHSCKVVCYLSQTCPLEAWELVYVTYLVVSTPTIHAELLRVKKHIDCTILIEPRPSTPNLPSTKGPIRIPAIRYAVTAGRLRSFARRERISPASKAIDRIRRKCMTKTFRII